VDRGFSETLVTDDAEFHRAALTYSHRLVRRNRGGDCFLDGVMIAAPTSGLLGAPHPLVAKPATTADLPHGGAGRARILGRFASFFQAFAFP